MPFPKGTGTLVAWTCVGAQSRSELEALQSARLMLYSSAFSHSTSFFLDIKETGKIFVCMCIPTGIILHLDKIESDP